MNTTPLERMQARAAELDALIARLEDEGTPVRARIAAAKAEMATTDDMLTRHMEPDNPVLRGRRKLGEAIAREQRLLNDVAERVSPLKAEQQALQADIVKALKATITAEAMDAAVNDATAVLADLQSKRPARDDLLAGAVDKLAEVKLFNDAETEAADTLNKARGAFHLAKPDSPKAEKARQAIVTAEAELAEARDAAANARAAVPRIESAIETRRADVEALDAQIAGAHEALATRTREREEWVARRAIEAASTSIRDAVARLQAVTPDAARKIVRALADEGLYTLDDDNRLQRPAWLLAASKGQPIEA